MTENSLDKLFYRTRGFLDLPDCLLVITFCGGMLLGELVAGHVIFSDGRYILWKAFKPAPVPFSPQPGDTPWVSEIRFSRCRLCLSYLHKSCLQRSLVPFTGEWCLETKAWTLGVFTGPGMSLYLATIGKESSCNAGDLIPGSGRSPGEGNGFIIYYSCLENSTDRGAWWATV